MSISMMIFTFINLCGVALFVALPLSIERGQHDETIAYQAAPKRIHWRKVFIITGAVALMGTLTIALIIKTGIVPVK